MKQEGESEQGVREETKTFPGEQLELTDGEKSRLQRGKGRRKGRKGDQEGVSTSVCEWRLSLEGAVRGHRGGTAGTPVPLFSSLFTGP